MIFLTIGLPGRFAEFCESLLAELVAVNSPRPEMLDADSLESLGDMLLSRDITHGVATVRRPRTSLMRALKTNGRPFLLLLDSPEACIAALMEDHKIGYLEAVRRFSSSCGALTPLRHASGALVLRADSRPDAVTLASRIAAHYKLQVSEAQIAAIVKQPELAKRARELETAKPPVYVPQPWRDVGALPPLNVSHDDLLPNLAKGAIRPFWDNLETGELHDIVWHRDLFFFGDDRAAPPPPVIDVTGRGRCLTFGPYIYLPEGSWSCGLMLGFSERAVGLHMVADVYTGVELNKVSFEVTEPGFFEIEFSFVLSNSDDLVEIRLFNADAAFEGHVSLIQATLKPLKAVRIPVNTQR